MGFHLSEINSLSVPVSARSGGVLSADNTQGFLFGGVMETPEGYCQCGCGQKMKLGQQYVRGHNRRVANDGGNLNPSELCMCGCGEKAPLNQKTNSRRGEFKGAPARFIQGHGGHKRGSEHSLWKGGRINEQGYVLIFLPDHPRADSRGYVREHILIAEKALGKPLPPKAVVHHANGSRNSGPLVICQDRAYHWLLHRRENKLKLEAAMKRLGG
jgi:hypothetical protein